METPDSIRSFWFGNEPDDAAAARAMAPLWWSKDQKADRTMRERFEASVLAASAGDLDSWSATPPGRLALILLTDQFPRNIYRGTPRSFAFDARALAWCLSGLDAGDDRALRPIERVFFYLPLEHSESVEHQEESVRLFRELAESVDPALAPTFAEFLEYAVRHRDIVARFGRFPHRNEVLGRSSTAEELAFLEEPGSSF